MSRMSSTTSFENRYSWKASPAQRNSSTPASFMASTARWKASMLQWMSETMPSFMNSFLSVAPGEPQDMFADVVEHHLVVHGRDAQEPHDRPDGGYVVLVAEGV